MLTRRGSILRQCLSPHAPGGYTVFRKALDHAACLQWRMDLQYGEEVGIFNDFARDGNRSQKPVLGSSGVVASLQKFCRVHFPQHEMRDPVVILSAAGCAEQIPHTDYDVGSFPQVPNWVPWSVVLCVERTSRFVLWSYSHKHVRSRSSSVCPGGVQDVAREVARKDLTLHRGDVLFFRGDLVHAGAGYQLPNTRVHAYLDHPLVRRPPNQTLPIDLIQNKGLRDVVLSSSACGKVPICKRKKSFSAQGSRKKKKKEGEGSAEAGAREMLVQTE